MRAMLCALEENMISPSKDDYITFTRRVMPQVTASAKSAGGVRHSHVVDPARISAWLGQGMIRRAPYLRRVEGELVLCVQVDTGPFNAGIITVVLDETCKMAGVQDALFADEAREYTQSMYRVDGGAS
jgi:hypothetical protein